MRVPARLLLLSGLLACGLAGLSACVPPPPAFVGPPPNPYPPVPPPREEARPLPPVSEESLVWRLGQWEWAGTGYVWEPGQYEPLDGHTNQYLPGHWALQGNSWVWESGHWL